MFKKIIDKRLLPVLLMLSLLLGVSLVAFAAGGDGSGGGSQNAGPLDVMAGTGFQLRLSNPDTKMSLNGGTYVLEDEFDSTNDIVFTFSLNPNGGKNGFGIYPAKDGAPAGFDGVIIYDKSDSAKTPLLSLGGNYSQDTMNPDFYFEEIEDSSYTDHLVFKGAEPASFTNEKTTTLTIKANKLAGGKTYCLYLPSTIKTFNNGNPKQFGADVIIEFSTSATSASVVESWTTGDCTAKLYDDGKLVIEANEGGTGTLPNYKKSEPAPWWSDPYINQIKQVEVLDGVTVIGNGAFKSSPNLTSAYLPESVVAFGTSVFNECGNLETVNIPSEVKEIPKNTFNYCGNLSAITLPDKLTAIRQLAFNYCDSLSELTVPATVTAIEVNSLTGIGLKDVYINSNADSIEIDKYVSSRTGQQVVFHVKCDQTAAFQEKNSEILNVTFSGDVHTPGDAVKENEVPATCTVEGSYDEVVYCSVCNEEVSRETKTIEALGHKEEVIEAVEPTCTEPGKTEGTKCSVCGEILKAQEEVPALGHNYEVIPEVISTCTSKGSTAGAKCTRCGEYLIEPKEVPMIHHEEETIPGKAATCTESGLTDGKKCSVCGETLEAQKEIPALGHDFKDGKCTRCDTVDPDYVKPVDPTPVAKLNGLTKGEDGKWAMYDNDKVVTSYTGLAKSPYNGNWYYLKNGYIDWNYTGFGQNLTTKKWYRVKDGRVDWSANSIYKKPETGAWYKCYEGRVTFKENGVFKNDYGWWYVKNSKVDFNFTGIASNKNGTWYIRNGYVDFNKNGKVTYNGKTYNVTNGRAKLA